MMKALIKTLLAVALCLPLTLSAQWTDGGTNFRTNNNVVIGTPSSIYYDTYSLYVRKDKTGWQGRFANRSGAGSDVYLSHGNGNGMHVRGWTTDSKYTLQLYNKDKETNIFYNNGKVGLGLAGHVGIGMKTPSVKLHVKGYMRSSNTSNTGNYIEMYHGGSNSFINHVGVGRMDFRLAGKNKMVLTSDGHLGIGTDTPDNKLDVNGTIRAKEIIVEEGWSDYVFYDDYQLPTLDAEEKHIEENGHLLGFESEENMAGEIQLGDVSKRQQAKIEEMMLHLIDVNKQLATMQIKIERLEKENARLKE